MKKGTLADKISSILMTTPSQTDPEDEFENDITAKRNTEFSEESCEEKVNQSQIRKQNIDLLADIDERYAGEEGSRTHLDFDEFSESDNNLEDNESKSDSSDGERQFDENYSNADNEPGQSSDGNKFEESDQEYGEDSDNPELEDTPNFNTDFSSQFKKGMCVKNQMNIWESLLEMRIQMQKCLLAANKMPPYETYRVIRKESEKDFSISVQKSKKYLSVLLDKLLFLQTFLWKKYPDMKKNQSQKQADEEISSDSEHENEDNEDIDENEETPKKRIKFSEFENDLKSKHDAYKEHRNAVIQKWHEKTRMPAMKNSVNVHSIIDHIEHTLADKDKLVKRTRLKRSNYKIIGEDSEYTDNKDSSNETKPEKLLQEYNSEIFDDDDFYYQLLRELIECKSADLTDPVQLGRQWIQLQNLRRKMKRSIDTKATKGRKIRYAVHTKLVNFMAPIDDHVWTAEAKTELFGSLFGKSQYATL